jgi:hypothetical protein
LVETLQDVEGWVNVVAIVCGGLLVVPFVSAVQVLRVLPATVPSRRSRSVASLVCSVGLVPVTVAFFAVFVYQVAEAVTQLSFAPLYFPMLKAAATAFLLCWPMFALSLWACRKLKRQHSLTVCTLKLIHLPIWVIMASLGWAGMSPPRALLDPSSIPSPGWRLAAQVVDGIGWLGVPIALWVSA